MKPNRLNLFRISILAIGLSFATCQVLAQTVLPGAPLLAFAAGRKVFVSTSGTGTACSEAAPCSIATAISRTADYDTIVMRGGVYEPTAGWTLSKSRRIVGSGSTDAAGPATRVWFGTSTNSGVAFAGGGPYTATVTGTVKAVYFDDATAFVAVGAFGKPLKKTRNTGTPTTPAAGEWGQSGSTLYLGDNPSGRTVRIVTGTSAAITVAKGCRELWLEGFEFGLIAGAGLSAPANQSSTQLSPQRIDLVNLGIFGCWDDTLGSGNMANSGIAIHAPVSVYASGLNIELCDNDLINLKQQCTFIGRTVYGSRAGDDCVSPHYGANLTLEDFVLTKPQQYAGADGNGITCYAGGVLNLNRGTILSGAAYGVFVQNNSNLYPPSRVYATDVVCRTGDWGTTGTVGWNFAGFCNGMLTRCIAEGFQNGTSGFGYYFDDGAATNIDQDWTLKDCTAIRNRVNIRTNRASATNTMRIHGQNFLHVDATAAEVSHAGASALTTGATTTDANSVAGVALVSFWID